MQAYFLCFITRKVHIGKYYNSLKLSFDLNINMYKVAKENCGGRITTCQATHLTHPDTNILNQALLLAAWMVLIYSPLDVECVLQVRAGTKSCKSPIQAYWRELKGVPDPTDAFLEEIPPRPSGILRLVGHPSPRAGVFTLSNANRQHLP